MRNQAGSSTIILNQPTPHLRSSTRSRGQSRGRSSKHAPWKGRDEPKEEDSSSFESD